MRIHHTLLAILALALAAPPLATVQEARKHARQIEDLREAARIPPCAANTRRRPCRKPSLSTTGIKGEISNIHVHEFETFMHDLPIRPLASQRNPKISLKDYPKRTALHEAVCFGMLSEDLARSINSKVPRLSARSETREDRQICLRMRACNNMDPELDILQDISLAEGEDNKEWAGFVKWCNGSDLRILMVEEPELVYGLMQLLPKVPELAERHPKVTGEPPRK